MAVNIEARTEIISSVPLAKDLIGRLNMGEETIRIEPCIDPYGNGKPCDKIRSTGCGYEDGPVYNPSKGVVECPLQRGPITLIRLPSNGS